MMKDFSILLLNNNRSKSYLQNFLRCGYVPRHAIVMGCEGAYSNSPSVIQTVKGYNCYFDSGISVFETLRLHGVPHTVMGHLDVNLPDVIKHAESIETQYIIYSGPAGVILRDDLLNTGKTFVHAHLGLLPDFKGSTTMYYSMLIKNKIGCSVIDMNREIDGGDILLMKSFQIPKSFVDFDMVLDPIIRTESLLSWLKRDVDAIVPNGDGNTYFIIHPVLKHLARLKHIESSGM